MNKIATLLLGFTLVVGGSILLLYRPGGIRNPHVWFFDITNDPQAETHYEQCLKDRKNDDPKALYMTVCNPPTHYAVIQLSTRGKTPDICVSIDFCVRHGESRVLPCQ